MTHYTHCALRLGDNLAALQLVRKLAQAHPDREFEHACPFGYMRLKENLIPVVADLPNVRLVDISEAKSGSVDLWKGVDGWFYRHPRWREYVPVMLDFYKLVSLRIGLPCPINSAEDMLADWPALGEPWPYEYDWLVINSGPLSGQLPRYNKADMDNVIGALASRYKVAVTAETPSHNATSLKNSTITEIGRASVRSNNIIMVSTGPSWATFNRFNYNTVHRRIILLANERVELSPNTIHAETVEEAFIYMRANEII